jgi:hypothetical protein
MLNEKLLRRVQRQILAYPRMFHMWAWLVKLGRKTKTQPCGTVGCIAGWTVELASRKAYLEAAKASGLHTSMINVKKRTKWVEDIAAHLLGLTRYEAKKLFFPESWPAEQYCMVARTAYKDGSTVKQAKAAAQYIDQFITEYHEAHASEVKGR